MALNDLPQGSRIVQSRSAQGDLLTWKNPDIPLIRYGYGVFILFWLGGWFLGETSAIGQLWNAYQQGKPLEPFLLFWVGGWTIGGVFAAAILFTVIRGARPATLELGYLDLYYYPGGAPLVSMLATRRGARNKNPFSLFFPGKPVKTQKSAISNLQMARVGEHLRVSFDIGARRIEVGDYLEEPEKEWLYKTLTEWLGR